MGLSSVFRAGFDITVGAILSVALIWYFTPVSYWYDAQPEQVSSVVQGEEPQLTIEREIKRDFSGAWSVKLRKHTGGRSDLVCFTEEVPFNYSAEATLPEDIGLEWWTWNRCAEATTGEPIDFTELEPGVYQMTTCHSVVGPFGIRKTDCRKSNFFEVTNGKD